jgi:hypothetical protein
MVQGAMMKKVLLRIVCVLALSLAAIPVGAQTRSRVSSESYGRRYDQRTTRAYQSQVYRDTRYDNYYGDDRSVWDKSRDKITTAAGAGAGAAIGALIGGKRGALIGAITGGGGAALYTYKIRDKRPGY